MSAKERAEEREGGERRDVTVLFADLAGLTAMTVAAALALSPATHVEERFLRLRVGVQAGAAVLRDGDAFGATINEAVWVADEAAPGQVVVTGDVPRRAVHDRCTGVPQDQPLVLYAHPLGDVADRAVHVNAWFDTQPTGRHAMHELGAHHVVSTLHHGTRKNVTARADEVSLILPIAAVTGSFGAANQLAELSVAQVPLRGVDAIPASSGEARQELASWAVMSDGVLDLIANAPASMNGLAAGSRVFLAQTRLSPRVRAEVALAVAEVAQAHQLAAFYQQRLAAIRDDSVNDGVLDSDFDPLLELVRQTVCDLTDARGQLTAALASGWSRSDIVDALRVAADVLWMAWLAQGSGLEPDEHGA